MFERTQLFRWRRRQPEILKERVQSLSSIRKSEREIFRPSLSETASLLTRDWGFNLQRDQQGIHPVDLPPAA